LASLRLPLVAIINSAGIPSHGPLEAMALEDMMKAYQVNCVGAVAVCQQFMKDLRKSRGRIILIGSVAALGGCPMMGSYAASKRGLEAVADALRVELYRWGVNVSVIEPGK